MWTKEESKAASQRRYYAKNKKKLLAYKKQWEAENPEKRKVCVMKWRAKNPEKLAAIKKASSAKARENLTDYYVSSKLAQLKGIHQTPRQLREHPEIIECFRAIMKLRRMCRTKKKQNANERRKESL